MSPSNARRLDGRIALVTGASRGIGRAAAIALAKEGAHVVLLSRTVGALEEVDDAIRDVGGSATPVPMDLKDADKVDALGPSLYQRWKKLDIFVASAGILGELMPLGHISGDLWNEVLNVNLSANWRLIRTLDPLLRHSEAGRAIFVSADEGKAADAYWGPYAVSKAGLDALVRIYANEIETTSVRANIINPGTVQTALRTKAFPGENPDLLAKPEDVAPLFVELSLPALQANGQTFDFKAT